MFNNMFPHSNSAHFGQRDGDMETYNLEHISRLGFPVVLNQGEATLDDIAVHMELRQRLNPNTIHKRINLLERIHNHPQPMDIYNPNFEDWVRHSDYREQVENATPHSLRNEWNAVASLLIAYNIPRWDYKPPSKPTSKVQKIPMPTRVREMIHAKYTDNKDVNYILQYLVCHTFNIGLRVPSEPVVLKTSDVDIEKGTIIITEPKKNHSTREIALNPQLMTGNNCKSLKYWVDSIRPKFENQYSDDYLYITTSGKPFTREYLRRFLSRYIKPKFPEYHPYVSRHWCATGRLIQEFKESKGHWNTHRVKNWLGHTKLDTTNEYIRMAETYLRVAPYDWFKCVLRRSKRNGGKHTEKRRNGVFEVCDSKYKEREGTDAAVSVPTQQEKKKSVYMQILVLRISWDSQPCISFSVHIEYKNFRCRMNPNNPAVDYKVKIESGCYPVFVENREREYGTGEGQNVFFDNIYPSIIISPHTTYEFFCPPDLPVPIVFVENIVGEMNKGFLTAPLQVYNFFASVILLSELLYFGCCVFSPVHAKNNDDLLEGCKVET